MKTKLPDGYAECNVCWAEIYPSAIARPALAPMPRTPAPRGSESHRGNQAHSGGGRSDHTGISPKHTPFGWWHRASLHSEKSSQKGISTPRTPSSERESAPSLKKADIKEKDTRAPPSSTGRWRAHPVPRKITSLFTSLNLRGGQSRLSSSYQQDNQPESSTPKHDEATSAPPTGTNKKGTADLSKVAWSCRLCGAILCPWCTQQILLAFCMGEGTTPMQANKRAMFRKVVRQMEKKGIWKWT
ncbi:uncharacterized protein EI97DRAFT_459432 [Westerdykella ornata]|uniref:Uncharacterized protein n=1 Tax=Westerdykella ornata TaxID=318751 RepID=A0A6A6JH54_WESOR|nr:uncharacterized protein EI97DRAFT_459432 [Westerdykella ornata]KAF2275534.1 hypothetical protein EI97DRAFT_459432 [Westerdykella ornata]